LRNGGAKRLAPNRPRELGRRGQFAVAGAPSHSQGPACADYQSGLQQGLMNGEIGFEGQFAQQHF
jgi:hypothetical protein